MYGSLNCSRAIYTKVSAAAWARQNWAVLVLDSLIVKAVINKILGKEQE